jgi:hypothetical protein
MLRTGTFRVPNGGKIMLIGGTYTTKFDSEESSTRNLQLFANWTPPAGFEFKAHWARADGKGGVFIAEVASAEALLEATSPWGTRMDFDIAPLVDITAAVPLFMKVQGWMASVS